MADSSANAAAPIAAAPSPTALEAQKVAQHYFDLLRDQRFGDAYELWDDSVAAKGDLAAFTKAQRAYTSFHGKAGDPSPIRVSGAEEFVLVDAAAQGVLASGKPFDSNGVVMLKRPAKQAQAGGWRIWGVDLRKRHCRAHEKPVGLGCVSA